MSCSNTCEVERVTIYKGAGKTFTITLMENGNLVDTDPYEEIIVLLPADAGGAQEFKLSDAKVTKLAPTVGGKIKCIVDKTDSALLKAIEQGDLEVYAEDTADPDNPKIWQKDDVIQIKNRKFT